MKIDYLDKFQGTLIGVAIGDTLGHPFEGMLRSEIELRVKNIETFILKNKNLFNTYTDDTQLTLHTAEALIQGKGFNIDNFVREYIKWLDDPPIGPGYGCIYSIRKLKYGVSLEESASNSGGNGTAMRISPIGLFYCKDLISLKEAAIKSSLITHNHSASLAGAVVIARAIAYLIDKNPKIGFSIDDFFDAILSSISNSPDKIWEEFIKILNKVKANLNLSIESGLIKFSQAGVKPPFFIEEYMGQSFVHPYTLSTVACAIFVFLNKLNSFKECIFELATAGGDTDSVGAIGGSLAGAYFGAINIPSELINIVKNYKNILKVAKDLYGKFEERYV